MVSIRDDMTTNVENGMVNYVADIADVVLDVSVPTQCYSGQLSLYWIICAVWTRLGSICKINYRNSGKVQKKYQKIPRNKKNLRNCKKFKKKLFYQLESV